MIVFGTPYDFTLGTSNSFFDPNSLVLGKIKF